MRLRKSHAHTCIVCKLKIAYVQWSISSIDPPNIHVHVRVHVCGALVQFGCYQHRHE